MTNISDAAFCPETGRQFEDGHGAWPREKQTAQFVRERDVAADMPKEGERCARTDRKYECGSGALTKTLQSARFVDEAKTHGWPIKNDQDAHHTDR